MNKFSMKKYFAAALLGVAACVAWASSPPSAVEAALAANDFLSARSMTQEALREHPESARVHLFNAYILAAADKDKAGAARELATARSLDLSGKVSGSPLFGRTAAVIEGLSVRPAVKQPAYVPAQNPVATYTPVEPVKESSGVGWIFVLVLLAGSGYFVYLIIRRPVDMPIGGDFTPRPAAPNPVTPAPTPYVPAYTPTYQTPAYAAPVAQPQQVVVNQGPSMAGSVVAGAAAGAVTALAVDSLLHHNRSRHDDSYYARRSRDDSYTQPAAPVPYDPPVVPAIDYQSRADSFSSGGSSWNDRAPPAARVDDSWNDRSSAAAPDVNSWSDD
jgi:hypothetical protein